MSRFFDIVSKPARSLGTMNAPSPDAGRAGAPVTPHQTRFQ